MIQQQWSIFRHFLPCTFRCIFVFPQYGIPNLYLLISDAKTVHPAASLQDHGVHDVVGIKLYIETNVRRIRIKPIGARRWRIRHVLYDTWSSSDETRKNSPGNHYVLAKIIRNHERGFDVCRFMSTIHVDIILCASTKYSSGCGNMYI